MHESTFHNTPGRRAACLPVGCLGTAWGVEFDVINVWSFLDHKNPPQPTRATITRFIERFARAMRVEPELCALGFYAARKKRFEVFDGKNVMGGGEPSPNGYKLIVQVRRLPAAAPFTTTDDQWDAIRDVCRPFGSERDDNVLPAPRPMYVCRDEDAGWNPMSVPPQPYPSFPDHIPRQQDCTDAVASPEDLRRLLQWLDVERAAHLRRAHKAKRCSWEELSTLKKANDAAMQAHHKAVEAGDQRATDLATQAYFLAEVQSQWRGTDSEESFEYV